MAYPYSKAEVTMMLYKSSDDWKELVGTPAPAAPSMFTGQSFEATPSNNEFKNATAIAATLAQLEGAYRA
jgi:hypothetical protein